MKDNEVKVTVKSYMTKKSKDGFDFMSKYNNDIPMPFITMVGSVEKETKGMYYMDLHGDIVQEITPVCMKCGRALTNPVSQYFGIGPECGGHNYVNPFDSKEELKKAVSTYKKELCKITWKGWIPKSAIIDREGFENLLAKEVEKVNKEKTIVSLFIGKSKECGGDDSVYVSFSQYDERAIDIVRNLPTRFYDKISKAWEVPYAKFDTLKGLYKDYKVEISGKASKKVKRKPVNYKFHTKPFQHQIEGFEYGMEHDKWLLADEQGLGKTKQVIDIACALKKERKYQHCFIICGVNGLKWNWYYEILKHSKEEPYILGQYEDDTIGTMEERLDDLEHIDELPYFVITNIETLRYNYKTGNKVKVRGKMVDERVYPIADTLEKLCKNGKIGMIATDEIHKMKDPTSMQGEQFLKTFAPTMIAMTGTPLMNNPNDLFIILKWLGEEKHSFYQFQQHYNVYGGFGGHQIVGHKNLDELQQRLNSVMLRRLKSEVFDLPEKTIIEDYVEMYPEQKKLYDIVCEDIKQEVADLVKPPTNPLSSIIRLRQVTGCPSIVSTKIDKSAKLDRMEELVDEAVANGKKVVIFSNWTQITDSVYERLHRYYPATITGETKADDRMAMVKSFQELDNVKVIIGTIGAMGTGLTLTAGTVVIFMDEPWNDALRQQAIDRCHRIGTKENVTVYILIAKGTADERVHELVEQKGVMADSLVDGRVNGDKLAMLNYLLG